MCINWKRVVSNCIFCYKFEQHIFGKRAIVHSDLKPLETIFKKAFTNAPKRLQRMLLLLQKYDLDVYYKPGIEMLIADTLSRDCIPDKEVISEDRDD